ncbi:hypothetical protein N8I71_11020 [Roseibacterium sp. SDUM158016]|jgi:urease beta subunit|uniref:hypothetical protein n=1 Tax=Roseicyclus sediminis TaxID=2980997 RepID=UPI0021CE09F6|nr:hypothetical protein [Roseibacterium sp. SDUM158016]MCU4653367.1 hypothetical protein [Roseibacterium sp. SDUM158016]
MQRIVQRILQLVPRPENVGQHLHLNRIARGSSYDRALAAFKAEQAERAQRNVRHVPGEWQSSRH